MRTLKKFKEAQKETEYTLMDKVNIFSYSPSYGVEISFSYNPNIFSPIDKSLVDTSNMKEINNIFSESFLSEMFKIEIFDINHDLKVYENHKKSSYVIESKRNNFTIMFTCGFFEKKITNYNMIELV